MGSTSQLQFPHHYKQAVGHRQIEEAPKDVDDRRREASERRLRKRAGKRAPQHTSDEVRDKFARKAPPKVYAATSYQCIESPLDGNFWLPFANAKLPRLEA